MDAESATWLKRSLSNGKIMTDIEKLQILIEKGHQVLSTHKPNPPGVIGFPTLDSQSFTAWQTQCINFLETKLPPNSSYVRSFVEKIKSGHQGTVKAGIGILQSVMEDLSSEYVNYIEEKQYNPIDPIINICDRFHLVARQLRSRYDERPTLDVQDEYDVQDLFHSLLHLHFNDIRPEEYTPSYAGKASRMDFLLKQEQIVIEIKKARPGFGAKELGTQLIEDIARYQAHPNCDILICFVYDPDGRIANPRGIEGDLNRTENGFAVEVLIRP